MATEKRKLSAKELVRDVRSGISKEGLMQKHDLSEDQLHKIMAKLVRLGAITKIEGNTYSSQMKASRGLADGDPNVSEEISHEGREESAPAAKRQPYEWIDRLVSVFRQFAEFLNKRRAVILPLVTAIIASAYLAYNFLGSKPKITREYAKSSFSIINIIETVLPEIACKVTALDRNKNTVVFVTGNERDMSIQIMSKGKDACSVKITGSAWFSDEPEEVAAKIHAKINDVLIRKEVEKKETKKRKAENKEAQKLASAQAAQPTNPIIHCPKCGTAFKANGTYVGRMAGTAAGAAAGAYVGSGIGIATLGTGFAATIPLGIGGGIIGFFAGGYYDNNTCPKCDHRFKQ